MVSRVIICMLSDDKRPHASAQHAGVTFTLKVSVGMPVHAFRTSTTQFTIPKALFVPSRHNRASTDVNADHRCKSTTSPIHTSLSCLRTAKWPIDWASSQLKAGDTHKLYSRPTSAQQQHPRPKALTTCLKGTTAVTYQTQHAILDSEGGET